MTKQIIAFLVLVLLCVSASAQKKDESKTDSNNGIIYGQNKVVIEKLG
ncbi:MAG: hypothetical protein ACR2N3_14610 [Pyrinomonadaceae bacterium]